MTFSSPSFFAAAIRAFIPPPWATEVTFDQSVPLLLPPLPEPLEQPAATSAPLSAAAATAIAFLFRTIPLRARDHVGQVGAIVAGFREYAVSWSLPFT